jgi:type I restriction enzyme R subunit
MRLVKEVDGIDSMFTLVQGMLHPMRLRDIICHFIFIPDNSKKEEKIVCCYPPIGFCAFLICSYKALAA